MLESWYILVYNMEEDKVNNEITKESEELENIVNEKYVNIWSYWYFC